MNRWAELVNDSSYQYDNVFPFYQRTVRFTPPNTAIRDRNATAQYNESAFGSGNGPLEVSYTNYPMPFSSWMKLGMTAIGINETNDFNSGSLMGSQYCTSTIRPVDQTRSSSHAAFLNKISQMPHLIIYQHTLAKKIVFDSSNRARGVSVSAGESAFTLRAEREVIVSSGVFGSPHLLMVSGIGDAEILAQYGINVVSDLPGVGQNMWDHVYFGPTYRVRVTTLTRIARDLLYLISQAMEYLRYQRGPVASPVTDFLAWEKIPRRLRSRFSSQTKADLSQFPSDWPEVEVRNQYIVLLVLKRILTYYDQYMSASGYVGNNSELLSLQPKDGYEYSTILASPVAVTSRGNVTITSNDMSDLPVINPNWLNTETDQQLAIAGYKRTREAFGSQAMAPIVIGDEYYPGIQFGTDTEILDIIKNNLMTVSHASCTCKMGTRDDAMAVLDSQARVFGVNSLRVVDASAFAILPPGHPQATVCEISKFYLLGLF